jgi:hypothetical protein
LIICDGKVRRALHAINSIKNNHSRDSHALGPSLTNKTVTL